MEDELLADILAAERDIRLQIETLKQRTAERLESIKQELDLMLENESRALQAELDLAQARAVESAQREAEALLAEARAFAVRLERIDTMELDRVVGHHLARILPKGDHDRQNEQA
jgi:vacuolar-type H+-ATPase subunit H